MAYYRICPICKATLDPGEHCTCEEEKAKAQECYSKYLKQESKAGQLAFAFSNEEDTSG